MSYDFSGLTPSQQALLTFCGWDIHCNRPKPRRSTVQPLIARGLVVLHPLRAGGTDPARYEVPIPVHAAWCAHCADTRGVSGTFLCRKPAIGPACEKQCEKCAADAAGVAPAHMRDAVEELAQGFDGCMVDAVGGEIDVGEAIRTWAMQQDKIAALGVTAALAPLPLPPTTGLPQAAYCTANVPRDSGGAMELLNGGTFNIKRIELPPGYAIDGNAMAHGTLRLVAAGAQEVDPTDAEAWYCEAHPERLMGHDGCTGAGIQESCRIHMLLNKLRLAEQECRETAMARDDLAAQLRRAHGVAVPDRGEG